MKSRAVTAAVVGTVAVAVRTRLHDVQPVNLTNTGGSTLTAGAVTFTLRPGHVTVGAWNAALTTSGQTVTARNLSYNGTVGPGQRVEFGFQASRPGGNTATPTNFSCMGS
jgi:cellulase/cellobiase CelA1